MSYFSDLRDGIRTTLKGLSLTMRHLGNATQRRTPIGVAQPDYFALTDGLVTLEYPHEKLPIPDNGRYRLHNEIDDCIVCDKCAKVCPVDCITIDPIKATEEVGRASDGSPIRLYAATFDIDMAKCCYCGLCTAVCPTECLTMEKTFNYSTFSLANLTYEFANLTSEQADEKRALYEQFVQEKEAAKRLKATESAPTRLPAQEATPTELPAKPKPAFRPGMKSPAKAATPPPPTATNDTVPSTDVPSTSIAGTDVPTEASTPAKPRPAFRPGMKPAAKAASSDTGNPAEGYQQHPLTDPTPDEAEQIAMAGVAEQPHVTEPLSDSEKNEPAPEADQTGPLKKTTPFRPTMKPAAPVTSPAADAEPTAEAPAPKKTAPFRPTMKPAAGQTTPPTTDAPATTTDESSVSTAQPAKPRPAFQPTMKPTAPVQASPPAATASASPAEETPITEPLAKPKPAFRPTMKPAAPKEPVGGVPEATTDAAEPFTSPVSAVTELPASPPDSSVPGTSAPSIDEPAESGKSVKPRPAFRPTMKPATPTNQPPESLLATSPDQSATPPVDAAAEPSLATGEVRSTEADSSTDSPPAESGTSPKPRPAFRPTMKPKSSDS